MNLIKIDLKKYSEIHCDVAITEDNSILYVKVSGHYRNGIEGNGDGLYLFSLLASHYLFFEPISIILDLSGLNYTWGNTIIKSLNFFNEIGRDSDEKNKVNIIIPSLDNKEAIYGVLKNVVEGKRMICGSYWEAFDIAKRNVSEYLE